MRELPSVPPRRGFKSFVCVRFLQIFRACGAAAVARFGRAPEILWRLLPGCERIFGAFGSGGVDCAEQPVKNYGHCCFTKNGPPTRRDKGACPHGPVTEEKRSRRAVFGGTLRAEGLLAWFFVVPYSQIHADMLARHSANQAKIPLSSNIHSFLTGCLPPATSFDASGIGVFSA